MEFGLLLLRLVIGVLFIGHGTQKLFGWFDGPGPDGTADMFESLGYRKPQTLARLGGGAEAGAGALLVLGLLTPLAAAAVIGVMINAIVTVHLPNGPWVSSGGYEYNVVLATAAATLAFAGPGALALDRALSLPLAGGEWGVLAVLIGALAGATVLTTRESPQQARERRSSTAESVG